MKFRMSSGQFAQQQDEVVCIGDRRVWRHVAIDRVVKMAFGVAAFMALGLDLVILRQGGPVAWAVLVLVGLFAFYLGAVRLRRQRPVLFRTHLLPEMRPWSYVWSRRPFFVKKADIVTLRILEAREVPGTEGWRPDRPAKVELLLRDGSKVYVDAVDSGRELMEYFLSYQERWDYVSKLEEFPSLEELRSETPTSA